jgi:hypothetical protein
MQVGGGGGNRTRSRPFRKIAATRDFRGKSKVGNEFRGNSLSSPVPWSPLESPGVPWSPLESSSVVER